MFKNQTQADEIIEETAEEIEADESREQDEIIEETAEEIIADYQLKIDAIDVKIEEHRQNAISDKKRKLMRESEYTDAQIERYFSFIQGKTDNEIKQSIARLSSDIAPRSRFGDPSAFNGEKKKPKTVGAERIGKTLFHRVRKKVFPGRW